MFNFPKQAKRKKIEKKYKYIHYTKEDGRKEEVYMFNFPKQVKRKTTEKKTGINTGIIQKKTAERWKIAPSFNN